MASTEPHGDDEAEVCDGCAFLGLRQQVLYMAIEVFKVSNSGNPQTEIMKLAKSFEAYLLGDDEDDLEDPNPRRKN